MRPKVEYCELAPDLKISRVLTGLWQIADMERGGRTVNIENAAKSMTPYVEAGFNTFDMADHYGSAEEVVGRFREKYAKGTVHFLTKWVPDPGPKTKQEVRSAVQRSLDRMRTDRLELLQFHAWNYADPSWLDCLFWLQELKEEGLVLHLGLTNFDTAHLSMVVQSGIEVVSNQICFSLLDQRATKGMGDLCLKRGIKILAFGTLAGGFFSERWLGKAEPIMDEKSSWSQMKYKRFIDASGGWRKFQDLLETVDGIAKRRNVSIANVASRYVLEQPAVGGVILGARLGESEHIREDLRLFEFSFEEEDRSKIAEVLTTLNPIPGDCGDEYRKPPFLTASGDLSHHVAAIPNPYKSEPGPDGRSKVVSGTVWEDLAGFSRAVRKGNRILVSGTTATHGHRAIGGMDPAAQTHFIIDKIEGALLSLGSKLEHVVRTRIFVRNKSDWEHVARAHGERFRHIQPANTLVQAELVGDEYLVEMEAEAIVGEASPHD
jgi:aryl-alcohol dehydrogenase-like predicted oxidoreductase/enamine deaminase RidA (YjgF/YER057c/UK114 family)